MFQRSRDSRQFLRCRSARRSWCRVTPADPAPRRSVLPARPAREISTKANAVPMVIHTRCSAPPLGAASGRTCPRPRRPLPFTSASGVSSATAGKNKHFSETRSPGSFRLKPANELQGRAAACHGPGSNHAKNATDKTALVGFLKSWHSPVATQNAQCLTCRDGGNRMHWTDQAPQE